MGADWYTRRIAEGLKSKRWINETDTGVKMLKCPECECRVKKGYYVHAVGSEGYNFCPYCGADMRIKE